MNERNGRNNDADRGWDQSWQSPRQQQQFHDSDYRQTGGFDDTTRNRPRGEQQGGGYSSYGGERQQSDYRGSQDYDRDTNRETYGRSSYGAGARSEFGRNQDWDRGASQRHDAYGRSDYYGGQGDSFARNQPARGYGGASAYEFGSGTNFSSFTGNDFGGRDFSAGSNGLYGSSYGGSYGRPSDRNEYSGWREYGERRGFLDRAGDEIASWFGDEDAARRRRQDHSGRGPEGYTRSDERIREDVNDALTRDWAVDASKVTVKVQNGEVTLDGRVPSRTAKRKAEDCAEDVSGVKHVQNNLRVHEHDQRAAGSTAATPTSAASTGTVTSSGTTDTTASRTTR